MKLRGVSCLKRYLRSIEVKFWPRAVILLYHRVAAIASDPHLLCVTPQHFAEQLEVIRQSCRPMGLAEIRRAIDSGHIPRRAVAITFDDGYADNLHNAKPLLQQYAVPATVFVATAYMYERREFWWDTLERVFLQPGKLPERLTLTIDGTPFHWELGEGTDCNKDNHTRHGRWNVSQRDAPAPHRHVYRSLYRLLRCMADGERQKVLDRLLAWASLIPDVRETHQVLSPGEILRLAEDGLVEIGSHTITHPVLSALPIAVQCKEIQQSKAHLEEILGGRVNGFAYPYGSSSDYSKVTVAMVRKAGFEYACSSLAKTVWRYSSPYELPRFLVRDWNGNEFTRRLEAWFHS